MKFDDDGDFGRLQLNFGEKATVEEELIHLCSSILSQARQLTYGKADKALR